MFFKIYQNYLIKLFLKSVLTVSFVFLTLSFFLNILAEIKFFQNYDVSIFFTIFLTLLNIPSIAFELFPFIFLISTQLFFMKLHDNEELIILKNYGLSNIKIIKLLLFTSLACGIFIITVFYNFSSELKHSYLSFKNNYTEDNKYLAVVNENGLWIRDEIDDKINIINAESLKENILNKVIISQFTKEYEFIKTINSKEVNIKNFKWILKNNLIFEENKLPIKKEKIFFYTSFDNNKIRSFFSNLTSQNILELIKTEKDYKLLGYSTIEINLFIQKLISLPIYLTIMVVLGSILMLNTKHNQSKILNIIIGIISSVSVYYLNYFINLMGETERIPFMISIWTPFLLLSIICLIGLIRVNEK
jgi:lipopolysaccharide export system permease protein|tara:strand:- start:6116 stop:7198 length:1083 start_codon:yes stop_codon:yes gene_type:complete